MSKTRAICRRQSLSKRLWRYENYSKSLLWLRRPADLGHPPSQYSLGIMCLISLGIPRDYKKAARWFHEAAQPDHPSAQFILCRLYISGKGIVRDPVHATRLFEKSAKNN